MILSLSLRRLQCLLERRLPGVLRQILLQRGHAVRTPIISMVRSHGTYEVGCRAGEKACGVCTDDKGRIG